VPSSSDSESVEQSEGGKQKMSGKLNILDSIKERDIPIEVLELENKNDKIVAFAWEPKHYKDLGVLFDKKLTNHCQLSCQLGDPDSVT
jgi:hypothetical protein